MLEQVDVDKKMSKTNMRKDGVSFYQTRGTGERKMQGAEDSGYGNVWTEWTPQEKAR